MGLFIVRSIVVFIGIFFAFAVDAQVDLQNGVIANYPFNGNAYDVSGNGYHGAVHNAMLTTDRFGNMNSAYKFDGEDDYILITGTPAFDISKSGYSLVMWVYIDKNQTNTYPRLIGYGGYGDNGWELEYDNNNSVLTVNFNTHSSGQFCHRYAKVNCNEWFQYSFVYTKDTVKVYLNGKYINHKSCRDYYPVSGFDLLIGTASDDLDEECFSGKIDDVRIYNRALSAMEVASLAGNNSAINAARKGAAFYADFENHRIESFNKNCGQDLENGGVLRVTKNPARDTVNSSANVMVAITRKSQDNSHSRAEFFSEWGDPFITNNRRHIFQWMVYFPENYLRNVKIDGDWNIITQFVSHPCAKGEIDFADAICGGGGIFNELRVNSIDYGEYGFEFRAKPDCNTISYNYPRAQWCKFTYEIYWTTDFDGYYRVWANDILLGKAENVRTLPEGFINGVCDIRWKVGLYDSWISNSIDSVYYYIDNIEAYVDKDIARICPGCDDSNMLLTNVNVVHDIVNDKVKIIGLTGAVGVTIYNEKGKVLKMKIVKGEFSISDLNAGVYFLKLKKNEINITKKIVKQKKRE